MKIKFNYLKSDFKAYSKIITKWKLLIKSSDFTLGKYVDKVEKSFSKYFGSKFVISVNSGTDALILALKALNVKKGDEVITAANTFYATAGAIVACGAKPILVDVNDNYQLDDKLIIKKISKKTKVIIPVYWGGDAPDMIKIAQIAKKFKLKIVEDSCMAIGGKYGNKHPGTFGDIGCFSFHPLKTINAMGDGGLVCTNNKKLYEWMKKYRNHGMVNRNEISIWGVNMRIQPLQAIVVLEGLKKINSNIKKRNNNAILLDSLLSDLSSFIKIPDRSKEKIHTFTLYMVRAKKRNKLLSYLIKNQIDAKIHYPKPLCSQKPYLEISKNEKFPNAINQSKQLITLPIHQFLDSKHIFYMSKKIHDFYLSNS